LETKYAVRESYMAVQLNSDGGRKIPNQKICLVIENRRPATEFHWREMKNTDFELKKVKLSVFN
jgi:hypothetical protein